MNKECYTNTSADKKYYFDFFTILAVFCYLILLFSVLRSKFVSVVDGSWLALGMGKQVAVSAFIAGFFALKKKYFICFFISLFASFFTVHEIIIFYDNYAIEAIEQSSNVAAEAFFRSIPEIFKDAMTYELGAFWAMGSSAFSFFIITIAWIKQVCFENNQEQVD